MSDPHQAVVDRNAEVVHRHPVGAKHHEVAEGVGVPRDLAANRILNGDDLVLTAAREREGGYHKRLRDSVVETEAFVSTVVMELEL